MSSPETPSSGVPPYVSYRTFRHFIDGLRTGIPGRIDRSVMGTLSGGVQNQLLAALRYFDLVDEEGHARDGLARIAISEDTARQQELQKLLMVGYPSLFNSPPFDLSNASMAQFTQKFKEMGASGDTVRKCAAFFLAAAQDAGMQVSQYITNSARVKADQQKASPSRPRRQGNSVARSKNGAASQPSQARDSQVETPLLTWQQLLLSKFPSFDPAWPDEVKAKWFDAFDQLMKMGEDRQQRSAIEKEVGQ